VRAWSSADKAVVAINPVRPGITKEAVFKNSVPYCAITFWVFLLAVNALTVYAIPSSKKLLDVSVLLFVSVAGLLFVPFLGKTFASAANFWTAKCATIFSSPRLLC
jgi:hypothetical protein